jgi:Protein kinase domain/AAA ATPase domain
MDDPSKLRGAPIDIDARYQVLAHLGRGGSADVYHVREISNGRELALKRLRQDLAAPVVPELTKHLEREFYALAQLRHPRVIEVYDYGVSEGLPYYTMELLDGGDLRTSAPLPWRRACELTYDVASSLALLHSRRFVHRDVSPSNIRCTRDGRAKLIDFGAMVSMGAGAPAIGTPAYVAPEVQQRGVLDAATDLFSLGATLYYMITGRPPFAALDLASMAAAWAVRPRPPSEHDHDLPAGLDTLILSLLSLEPAHRPQTAFEVMQRLAALADLRAPESAHVSSGYLSVPHAVGRDAALRRIRGHVQNALSGTGSAVWIEGEAGVGRSRLLDLCTLEAKTSGACVLRLDATGGARAFEGAGRLARALRAALPEVARAAFPDSAQLRELIDREELERTDVDGAQAAADGARLALQEALTRWLLDVSAKRPIVLAIDDAHRVDEPTLAWLAALAHAAPRAHLALIVTAELDSARDTRAAHAVLKRQSTVVSVTPLTRSESDAMFASVFGAVPNLRLLSERIFALAAGNPRRSLAIAQYLVDHGQIVYAAGAWSLPNELPLSALPASVEAVFGARVARLGPLARRIAETHALSLVAAMHRDDYRKLATDADPRSLDDALTELIAHEIVRSEGGYYVLAHRGYAAALEAKLASGALAQRHEALARLAYERGENAFVVAYHLLHAGKQAPALELLAAATDTPIVHLHELDQDNLRSTLERALAASEALNRPKRERFELLRLATGVSLLSDSGMYWQVAPAWLEQTASDAGLPAYRARADIADPVTRVRLALADTQARYLATPEHDRVYRIDEAMRFLALYVVRSIPIATREMNIALLRSLPALIEPFVSLSPLLAEIAENVEACCDSVFRGRPERGYARWQRVYERLEKVEQVMQSTSIRAALAYGLGELAAAMGLSSAALQWVERLDRDPMQRVNAMRVRRTVCLQHGDWAGAERAREQAELMALQSSGRQIFEAPLRTELHAQWLARNLAGVKQTAEHLGRVAAIQPGWRMHQRLAEGYFEALRGDPTGALVVFDDCVQRTQPDPCDEDRPFDVWLRASAAAMSMLLDLDRVDEARARGERVLKECATLDIQLSALPIECMLALAEARSGDAERATARIEAAIADQRHRGVTGLLIGACYETGARVAIAIGDQAAAVHYAGLVAQEFRHGTLTSRHGRLLQEARNAGMQIPERMLEGLTLAPERSPEAEALARSLENTHGAERTRRVLQILCEHGHAASGHLYCRRAARDDLECTASLREPAPSEALTRFAQGFWQSQLEEAEMSAVLTEVPWASQSYKSFTWRDPRGDTYEVLVLYSARVLPPHVALACLNVSDRADRVEWSTGWLSAIALCLRDERE